MKTVIIFLFTVFSIGCSSQIVESQKRAENPPSETPNSQSKQPVLVELYTSEGCSSCPPADRALAFLDKEQPYAQAEVITLALHVDYWDNLGWKDAFSTPLFTQRQELYTRKLKLDSAYTPQMIVDGRLQFVGSDLGKAAQAITEAAKFQKGKIEAVRGDGDKWKIKISALPAHESSNVFLAIAEDNLASDVSRGENSGKKLEHQSVVRELKSIGTIGAQETSAEIETALTLDPKWKKQNLKMVVFVQENDSRKIFGVVKVLLE